jgi:hypothetical protein
MYYSYIIYVQECDMEHTEDVQMVKFYTSFNANRTINCCEWYYFFYYQSSHCIKHLCVMQVLNTLIL